MISVVKRSAQFRSSKTSRKGRPGNGFERHADLAQHSLACGALDFTVKSLALLAISGAGN
jgi:hypothetical protein